MDPDGDLIAEQLKHALDLLRGEMEHLRQEQAHNREFTDHRLKALEDLARDHETRLRSATDGVTQFKVWSGLASGGSWVVSIVALIRAWFGG